MKDEREFTCFEQAVHEGRDKSVLAKLPYREHEWGQDERGMFCLRCLYRPPDIAEEKEGA